MATQEKMSDKASDDDYIAKDLKDLEAVDPTVVDESTHDPHMHRSLKGRHVSMIAIVSLLNCAERVLLLTEAYF